MALRALEFCLHCLDASPWPFTLDEVLQNYALAVEAPCEAPSGLVRSFNGLPCGFPQGYRLMDSKTHEAPEQFVWQHSLGRAGLSAYSGGASYSLEAMNSLAPSSQVRFTLLRLQVGTEPSRLLSRCAGSVASRWRRPFGVASCRWTPRRTPRAADFGTFFHRFGMEIQAPDPVFTVATPFLGESRTAAALVGHGLRALDPTG